MVRSDGTKNNHAVLFLCCTTDIVNHVKCNISEIFFTSQHERFSISLDLKKKLINFLLFLIFFRTSAPPKLLSETLKL